ncbi:MAG: glycosyltransferase family 2 protein [Victivallaceae bacterium]|nr:glycosyltransferase family 2 protein [Victivallaceae bacterium]
MKISVITAVYNGEKYIRETVESVLSQRGNFELEYIICDGQSTDRTLEILRDYKDSCRIISRRDGSPQEAINYGMELATGDLACWLNADDIFLPGALAAVVRTFEIHPGCRWVYGNADIIDADGRVIRRWISRYKSLIGFFYSWNVLLCENFISQPSTFWKLDLWQEVSRLDPEYKAAWDYELWLDMAKKSRPVHIRKMLSAFRRHNASISENHYRRQFDEELAIARRYCNFIHYLIHAFNRWKTVTIYRLLSRVQESKPRNTRNTRKFF